MDMEKLDTGQLLLTIKETLSKDLGQVEERWYGRMAIDMLEIG